MKLIVKRIYKSENYTIGDLFIDGFFFCNTIEDKVRELPELCPNTPKGLDCKCVGKVYAETAIPSGIYKLTITYSPKFKRYLPLINDVPHFIGIRIHSGTTEKDSAGCIIVGKNTIKGKVTQSRDTLTRLIQRIKDSKDITIEIDG